NFSSAKYFDKYLNALLASPVGVVQTGGLQSGKRGAEGRARAPTVAIQLKSAEDQHHDPQPYGARCRAPFARLDRPLSSIHAQLPAITSNRLLAPFTFAALLEFDLRT